jgi:hypothetical protein
MSRSERSTWQEKALCESRKKKLETWKEKRLIKKWKLESKRAFLKDAQQRRELWEVWVSLIAEEINKTERFAWQKKALCETQEKKLETWETWKQKRPIKNHKLQNKRTFLRDVLQRRDFEKHEQGWELEKTLKKWEQRVGKMKERKCCSWWQCLTFWPIIMNNN